VRPIIQAGTVPEYLAGTTIIQDGSSNELTPTGSTIRSGKAAIVWDISREPYHIPWRRIGMEYGIHSMGVFPMRHGGRILGTLNIYTHKHNTFDPEEIELLQELGDDIAYALISLEARRQQAVLKTAIDTMQDGMLIMDTHGEIIYNNPAIAQMVNCENREGQEDLSGIDFRKLAPTLEGRDVLNSEFQRLLDKGSVDFEFEHNPGSRNHLAISITASLVGGNDTEDTVVVVNLHDTTRRRRYERHLLSLNTFVTEMVQAYELEGLTEKIFLAAERLLEADASAVYIADVKNKQIKSAYYHKLPEAYLERLRSGYAGLPGDKVLSTGQPVLISDTQRDDEFGEKLSFLSGFGIHAVIVLPVFFQETPLGTLVVYYNQPREISQEDVQLGLTLARTLAIVIQNIHLFEAEHGQRQYAEALTQAAAAVNTSLELDQVLDRILEQTLQVMACRSVNMMLIEGEYARVVRAKDAATPERATLVEGKLVPLSIPTLKMMMSTGEPLSIADTRQSPLWSQVENTDWINSYAAAPLIVHDQIIGFLSMNSDSPDYFTETVTQRIQAFAETAATAIQNARLYESLRDHSLRLEDRVKERTAELSETKEQIEKIILSVPDAVFVLDESGSLVRTNPAGETLLADSEKQEIELFAEEFVQTLEQGSTSDPTGILEINGRSYQALASPLPDSSAHSGKVVVFRDVTRFRELDRLKTQFVSDVSHELRTPLTNLSIYLDLLSSVTDTQKRAEYLDTLRRETVRLTHLIEDLLTISRLEAGRLEFNIQPVDVRRVVHNLAEDRAAMAARQSLKLNESSEDDLPLAWADPRLLTQVLSNLLTNALNYTLAEGSISITAEQHTDDSEGWVRIRVRDTGVGIETEEIEDLFKRFYRGKASRKTGAPGTGLGLAISQEIIERFGGRISLERHPEGGSSFIVWLHPVL
jgi:PAS domain S-box-containing protein